MATDSDNHQALRVLVVSDNQPVRDEFAFGFPVDAEVSFARDSRDARTQMRKEIPSVVVVDLQTGSAGGFNLAKEMSETKELADVPVVMLLEREQDAWLARQAGAHAYRLKPVTALQVLADLQAPTR